MPLTIESVIQAHHFQFVDLAVSPDDQSVLVVFGNKDLPHEYYSRDEMNRSLWRVRLSDGSMTQLAPPDEDAHGPCWSSDGQQIAYLSRQSGKTEIWTMDQDGTHAQQRIHSNFPAINPFDGTTMRWSPGGLSDYAEALPGCHRRSRLAA